MANNVEQLHTALTVAEEVIELNPTQLLRAAAIGEVFAQCRPSFTEDDEDDMGGILSDFAGWVLWGQDYGSRYTTARNITTRTGR